MSKINLQTLISRLSLERHLTTYFEHDIRTPEGQQKWFLLFGWLFDQYGIEAYSADAQKLVKMTTNYLKSPFRNKTRLHLNHNWALQTIQETNNISQWFTFLSFEAIENFIRPIHRKIMLQVRRAIEGMVAQEYDNPERTKQLTTLLKQLTSVDDSSNQAIIVSETVPKQHRFHCKNNRCDNTIASYQHPLIKCLKCGGQQTIWNPHI